MRILLFLVLFLFGGSIASQNCSLKSLKKKRASKSERGALTPGQLDALAARIGYDGRFIRTVRERRGLSIEDLSSSTRISINFLKAIEIVLEGPIFAGVGKGVFAFPCVNQFMDDQPRNPRSVDHDCSPLIQGYP